MIFRPGYLETDIKDLVAQRDPTDLIDKLAEDLEKLLDKFNRVLLNLSNNFSNSCAN